MRAAGLCASLAASLALTGAAFTGSVSSGFAVRLALDACTAPPAPGTTKRVSDGHAKASSLAPHSRSRKHAYGAPIQRPILSKRKRPHPAENPAPR